MDHKRLRIAVHETGHAVMALICGQAVQKVSLKEMNSPRGTDKYLGFTKLGSVEQKIKFSGQEAIQKIRISLGGYASEGLFFEGSRIGGDDLTVATDLVEEMLKIEEFKNWVAGLPVPDSSVLPMIENPLIKAYIDYRIQQCMRELAPFGKAIRLIAEELYKREELTGDEISAIYNSFMQSRLDADQVKSSDN